MFNLARKRAHAATAAPRRVSETEEELIYGERRRGAFWQKFGVAGWGFGAVGCIMAAVIAASFESPAPVLVPFDPSSGMALPMVNLETISVSNRNAVVQSLVHAYVRDRETYSMLDNDLRVRSVLARSSGAALHSMRSLWASENPDYPQRKYGPRARMDVEVLSVTLITNDRAQVRLRKRLQNDAGETQGLFTVTLAFRYETSEARSLEEVWTNPFGFSVYEYAITSDRLEVQ
ncbi:type IV secretion system protein [Paracoccus liaowanqingii]|uniref:Type IV secretion system protein n=1 Tax=Paracoccus liaowanqingii TaxID=2560053 RepID=A0A4Z1CSB3_9RHOB|nr:type IV secretion system protein [Paracoccus liaowanqingii]TGN68317.1 type IV secretion system protein [Paracoccus liaowanqingii]